MTSVRVARAADADGCVEVLARLPDFFTPDTHDAVRRGLASHCGWVALEADVVVGFVLAEARYAETAEITFAAVTP